MSGQRIMKAVQRLAGQAATAVQQEKLEQLAKYRAQMPAWSQQYTTTAANTTTLSLGQLYGATTTAINTQWPNIMGGGAPMSSGGYAQTGYAQPKPTIEFTDEQRASFLSKLADLLTKGWECLRCHRIWSPQVTGCEFCNFIDRLEGKDVERDDAA